MSDGGKWQAIEREALEQVRAQLTEDEPERGHSVAWTLCRFGRTDGFSAVHRVGPSVSGTPMTLCGQPIPEPIKLVPLTPNLARVLSRCRYCEQAKPAEAA